MSDRGAAWPEWDPAPLRRGGPPESILGAIPGSVWFRVSGRDRTRCRVLTTLLHGNEPSGIRAIGRYLAGGATPATDLVFMLGAIEAARLPPTFSHRSTPGGRDLNRCFRAPFDDAEGAIAMKFLELLDSLRPECLADLHNTSGRGPSYAVVTERSSDHDAVASLFTKRLIVTDLRLGTLTETTTPRWPSVVVECGGARDEAADAVALQGLRTYAERERVVGVATEGLEIFEHPVRVELKNGCRIAYADGPVPGADIVLAAHLDRFNFGVVPSNEHLGWVGERGVEALTLRTARGTEAVGEYLTHRGHRLVAAKSFRPLMITTRPDIAESDCLFYAIPDSRDATTPCPPPRPLGAQEQR